MRSLWSVGVDGVDSTTLIVASKRHAQEVSWPASGRYLAFRDGFDDAMTRRDIHYMAIGEHTSHPIVATNADEENPAVYLRTLDGQGIRCVRKDGSVSDAVSRGRCASSSLGRRRHQSSLGAQWKTVVLPRRERKDHHDRDRRERRETLWARSTRCSTPRDTPTIRMDSRSTSRRAMIDSCSSNRRRGRALTLCSTGGARRRRSSRRRVARHRACSSLEVGRRSSHSGPRAPSRLWLITRRQLTDILKLGHPVRRLEVQ